MTKIVLGQKHFLKTSNLQVIGASCYDFSPIYLSDYLFFFLSATLKIETHISRGGDMINAKRLVI